MGVWPEKTTQEVIDKIVRLLKEGKLNKKQISEECGVSYSTVYRYESEYGLRKRKASSSKQNKNTDIKKSEETKGNTVVVSNIKREVIEVGLINQRHEEIPTNRYIYYNIDSVTMFNYNKLDNIVTQFLYNNIKFKKDDMGEAAANADLVVYVTGLTYALASVIKVCNIFKVNLTLMHYNISDRTYYPQIIWNSFGKNFIQNIFSDSKQITMYNCEYKDINKSQNIYYLYIVDFKSKNKYMRDKTTIVCSNEKDLIDQFGETVKSLLAEAGNTKKTVYAYRGKLCNGTLNDTEKINQFSNFAPKD